MKVMMQIWIPVKSNMEQNVGRAVMHGKAGKIGWDQDMKGFTTKTRESLFDPQGNRKPLEFVK